MLTHEKETMLNKVLQLENWFEGYLAKETDAFEETFTHTAINYQFLTNIKRNLNSIKSLINKA